MKEPREAALAGALLGFLVPLVSLGVNFLFHLETGAGDWIIWVWPSSLGLMVLQNRPPVVWCSLPQYRSRSMFFFTQVSHRLVLSSARYLSGKVGRQYDQYMTNGQGTRRARGRLTATRICR